MAGASKSTNPDLPNSGGEEEKEVKTTGVGAFAGMIDGGMLGLPFGPLGAIVGGLLGAVMGDQLEYVGAYRGVEERGRFLQSLIISFLKEKLGIEFVDEEDFYRFVPTGLNELKMPRVFKNSIDLSSR